MFLLHLLGVRNTAVYVVVGAGIWLAFLKSGVHPTVAGVLLGLATPSRPLLNGHGLLHTLGEFLRDWAADQPEGEPARPETMTRVRVAAREATSPLERLEYALHPWVAFVIMPVFALANAGVRVERGALADPVALAVGAGLVLGKPVGVCLFSGVGVWLGLARLPAGVNAKILVGGGCLAGIGFTMSLFIAQLALEGALLDAGKVGVLAGSLVSAAVGLLLLVCFLPRRTGAIPGATGESLPNKTAQA
jgi:NhaA family Na+:H+ antiporter